MQTRFLLGPAGSGKTFRCLAEIRAELLRAPNGPPLILLAPKQATFQIERDLLADGSLAGYTRLQIVSFERLAEFIVAEFSPALPGWLADEGRVMILRALLARHRGELRLFHATARLPGFAKRLSALLQEFQRQQISPQKLFDLAGKKTLPSQLRDKLHDFALLLRAYQTWLADYALHDASTLITLAAEQLKSGAWTMPLAQLWLDGFAEMTAQELDLLAALVPQCQRATLAFCLDAEIKTDPGWLSPWAIVGQTFLRCRERLEKISTVQLITEVLSNTAPSTRFARNPTLAHLEKSWASGQPAPHAPRPTPSALQLFRLSTPDAEAVHAAREILAHVQRGGRFRETAVLVRSLDGYADTLRRVFARYEIPCYLDRREPVAHHPLAELTRYALRLAAYGWRHDDWFGALKTGLVPVAETEIDSLENAALQFGWDGKFWLNPIADSATAENLRQQIVPPFKTFSTTLATAATGEQLATALQNLWHELDVQKTFETWSAQEFPQSSIANCQSPIHATVWEQLQKWLGNLARAFPDTTLTVRDWLPIVESGLATLTVGVIPPALDQVVIGALDRSRTPELKLAVVLGLNEGIFPAPPRENSLLNELERDELSLHHAAPSPDLRRRLGHERYFGYVAVTRASERLVLTCAQTDARGKALNRSPFFDQLEKIFPEIKLTDAPAPAPFDALVHPHEIIPAALQLQSRGVQTPLLALPQLTDVLAHAQQIAAAHAPQLITPAHADALYGSEFKTSVSALEDFGACPFKFFVGRGLRAQERKEFELDARQRGSFQHELLKIFHNELLTENLKWRDLTPDTARARVRRLGHELLPAYERGLFTRDAASRFAGETLLAALETLLGVLIGWARDYQFDPALVEVGFGLPEDSPWPAWTIPLDATHQLSLRGRIDRVDLWRDPTTGAALAVVVDYKSSARKPDQLKLAHGVQLQLPAYLAALENIPESCATLGVEKISAAGVFYVNLRGEFSTSKTRDTDATHAATTVRESFQHVGRYDEAQLAKLDPAETKEQFKTGKTSHDRLPAPEFRALLDDAVANLKQFGTEIFAGKISVTPFRKGSETACDFCDYASVCRFDAWTQPFRILKAK
ncbi:MAG: ATP-dependent helicase/deoxyribonuclease subunit [Verrucomicrobiota bacterium]